MSRAFSRQHIHQIATNKLRTYKQEIRRDCHAHHTATSNSRKAKTTSRASHGLEAFQLERPRRLRNASLRWRAGFLFCSRLRVTIEPREISYEDASYRNGDYARGLGVYWLAGECPLLVHGTQLVRRSECLDTRIMMANIRGMRVARVHIAMMRW